MQPLFKHRAVLFATSALTFSVLMVSLSAQQFPDITASHFVDHCIKCRCYWSPPTSCKVNLTSSADCETCGPLAFTVSAWEDADLPEFKEEIPWNETHKIPFEDAIRLDETFKKDEFRKCVTKLDCATRAALFYTNKYKRDCNFDGKFDCIDAVLITRFGASGCRNRSQQEFEHHNRCYHASIQKTVDLEVEKTDLVITVVVPAVVIVLVAVGGAIGFWGYRRWRRKQMAQFARGTRRIKRAGTFGHGPLQIPSAIIPPSEVHIENSAPIGEGQFGKVYRGTYNNTLVAIKAPKVDAGNSALIADLKKELEMMSKLGDHEFIVKFYGAEVSGIRRGEAYIVMEFSLYGALVDYVRRHSPKLKSTSSLEADQNTKTGTEAPSVTSTNQLLWTEQIASGMAFLESKSLLHGDLAARNVLVFSRELVKISDFGFARHLGNYEFYQKKEVALPWRWMPPECLKQRLFSIKSDVWAFAVTAWEIYTYGTVPYAEFPSWSLDFVTTLTDGRYLEKPDEMPSHVYSICIQCWSLYPNRRPSFATLQHELNQLRTYGQVRLNDYESVAGISGISSGRNVNFTIDSV